MKRSSAPPNFHDSDEDDDDDDSENDVAQPPSSTKTKSSSSSNNKKRKPNKPPPSKKNKLSSFIDDAAVLSGSDDEDDSDEDEDDEEGNNNDYERDGFVVDEADEDKVKKVRKKSSGLGLSDSDDDDDDDDDDDEDNRKKRKNTRMRRLGHANVLDEDDLALIQESQGRAPRPVDQDADKPSGDLMDGDDEDDSEEAKRRRKAAAIKARSEKELQKQLFVGGEGNDNSKQKKGQRQPTRRLDSENYDEDDMDDFIDYGEGDRPDPMDMEDGVGGGQEGVSEAQLNEATDIFGTDFMDFAGGGDDDEEDDMDMEDDGRKRKYHEEGVGVDLAVDSDEDEISSSSDDDDDEDQDDEDLFGIDDENRAEAIRLRKEKRKLSKRERRKAAMEKKAQRQKARLRKAFEPVQLVENFCTDRDDEIRKLDAPERFFDWRSPFHGPKGLSTTGASTANDVDITAEEEEEAMWIVSRIPSVASEFYSNATSENPSSDDNNTTTTSTKNEMKSVEQKRQSIVESIVRALRYMHVERLEPEFVRRYRADYVSSPSVRNSLYEIMDEDGDWDQLIHGRRKAEDLMDKIAEIEKGDEVVGDHEERLDELRKKLQDAREELDSSVKEEERIKAELEEFNKDNDDDDELFGDDDEEEDEEKKAQKAKKTEKTKNLNTAEKLVKAQAEIVANLTSSIKMEEEKAAESLSSSGRLNVAEVKKKSCISKLWNPSDYKNYLSSISELRHATDLHSYISLLKEGNDAIRRADANGQDDPANKKQRSKRADRDYYRTCVSQGLRAICYRFVLSPFRVGIKLEDNLTKPDGFNGWDRALPGENPNSGDDEDGSADPKSWDAPVVDGGDPSDFASDLVGSGELVLLSNMSNAGVQDADHPEIKDPLRGCRYVAAMELAFEPRIRKHLRGVYRSLAVISTRPTSKGVENIDPFHEYYGLHLLKNKKVKDHFPVDENEAEAQNLGYTVEEQRELSENLKRSVRDSCIQYMNLLKAEKTGHLKMSVHLPFVDDGTSDKPWYEKSDSYFQSRENQNLSPLMQELEKAYYPMQADSDEWNEERKKILHFALTNFLLPRFEAETKRDLRDAAIKMGIEAAKKNLYNMAMEGPYRPSHLLGENRFLVPTGDLPVVGVCCSSDGRDATYLAAVNEKGEMTDHLAVPAGSQIDGHKMREKVVTFLMQAKPSAIVVGTTGGLPSRLVARKLGDLATQATERWNNRLIQGQDEDDGDYQSRLAEFDRMFPRHDTNYDDEEDEGWMCNVELVDDNIAQLFGRSVRGKKEFPDTSVNLKSAIACARYAKDPLAEITYTWSSASDAGVFGTEMLYLNIHPLQQILPKALLLREYERVLCHVVGEVGVDVNLACKYDHLQGLLTFVPGLGPRKAASLKQSLDRIGGMIASRRDLLAKRLVGPVVYNNSVAFLRIRETDSFREDQVYHPLDDTRLHPDVYTRNNLAIKIALNALDRSEMDYEEEDSAIRTIRDVIEDSKKEVNRLFEATKEEWENTHQSIFNVSAWDPRVNVQSHQWEDSVENLDLESFAEKLAEKGDGKWLTHLNMIKEEFRLPFEDPRKPMEPLDKEKLFTLLTGENDQTLCPGKEVTGKVTRNSDFGSHLKLEADVPGFIPLRNLADGHVESAEDIVQVGKVVTAIVTEVKKDHMSVDLSLKMEDIKKPPSSWERPSSLLPLDASFDRVAAATIEEELAKKREERLAALMPKIKGDDGNVAAGRTGRVTRRACAHPAFRNEQHRELDQELRQGGEAMVGEALIRPSSKEADNLVLHWLVQPGVVKVVIIEEGDKDNDVSIGNSLKIKEEVYGDIDELLARYISPMNERVEEVVHHRKFMSMKKEDVEKKLKNLKAETPSGIFYFLCWNEKFPGCISLRFIINSVKSHIISISPEGFVWCGKIYPNIDYVINAFKKNPSGRSSKSSQPSSRTQNSSESRTSRWGARNNLPPPPAASQVAPPPPATNGGWNNTTATAVTVNSNWNNGQRQPPPPALPPPPTNFPPMPPPGNQGWNQPPPGHRPPPPSLPPPPHR